MQQVFSGNERQKERKRGRVQVEETGRRSERERIGETGREAKNRERNFGRDTDKWIDNTETETEISVFNSCFWFFSLRHCRIWNECFRKKIQTEIERGRVVVVVE